MKITLEPHYNWPDRTVLLVEGRADELDDVFDFVNANRHKLRASPFWMRGNMGWCEFQSNCTYWVKKHFCEG